MAIREIKMKIHEESDLYSEFDPDQKFQQQKDDLGFALKKLTLKEIALAVIGVVILSL